LHHASGIIATVWPSKVRSHCFPHPHCGHTIWTPCDN